MTAEVEPFEIRVDDSVLEDLHDRLSRTRFPDQIGGSGWEYGLPVGYLRELVGYWLDRYDWRAEEARLNQLDHFRTTVDGQSIHFLHARSGHPDALPLLLTHGWPGSFVEFLEVIPRLAQPEAFGGDVHRRLRPGRAFPARIRLLRAHPIDRLGRGAHRPRLRGVDEPPRLLALWRTRR